MKSFMRALQLLFGQKDICTCTRKTFYCNDTFALDIFVKTFFVMFLVIGLPYNLFGLYVIYYRSSKSMDGYKKYLSFYQVGSSSPEKSYTVLAIVTKIQKNRKVILFYM